MFSKFSKFTSPKTLSLLLSRNISVGQSIPNSKVFILTPKDGSYERSTVDTQSLFSSGKSVLVGYPGAFTPDCSRTHIPEYIKQANDLQKNGAAKVYAIAVNDPFVVQAFAEKLVAGDKVSFISDPTGEFIKQLDLGADLSAAGLGFRCRRFSMIIDNGKVVEFNDEKGPKMTDLSRVANILSQLQKAKKV